ncbi:MAG TPA: hypothetical protein VGT07_02805 [Steroidobacteraceae bacterium]|nr:hypothetical protein [Steroidobacteraceae bacterium]
MARSRPGAARIAAAVALAALIAASAGCSRRPHQPDWVIHSSIEVVGPSPPGGYRLIFPYIVGDLYGAPNTGAFVVPVSLTPAGFTLDLNRTQEALESELEPTDFGLRFLRIAPHDARLARLTPVALQSNGIESVGTVEWRDARSHRPLMLVYFDRPARIEGSFIHGSQTLRYDIRAAKAGYVWVGTFQASEHDSLYTGAPPPQRLILTITTVSPTTRSGSTP